MNVFFRYSKFIALALLIALTAVSGVCEETEKEIVFVNRTGSSIAEFYFAPESSARWGALVNSEWIKTGTEVKRTFTAEELTETVWKARIGVYHGGKIDYFTFNNVDLAGMLETGFANFLPESENKYVYVLEAAKKEFFAFSNTTDFTITSLQLAPVDAEIAQTENRLSEPLKPEQEIEIRMPYEEVMMETTWSLRLGAEKDGSVTYFTLKDFPLEKFTGCECVCLQPYKNSISFYYENN